jgi:hypothetical protein
MAGSTAIAINAGTASMMGFMGFLMFLIRVRSSPGLGALERGGLAGKEMFRQSTVIGRPL